MLFKSKKLVLFLLLAVFSSFAFQNCSRYLFQSQRQFNAPTGSSTSSSSAVMASLHSERNYSDEVFVGYQGWFATPDDDYTKTWFHWKENETVSHVDLLPDVSIYPDSVLTAAPFNNGYKLFPSTSATVVDVHTELIAKAGVDGFAVQRFVGADLENRDGLFAHKNRVIQLVRQSAEKWGTKFYLQYDTSGTPANWVSAIKNDFNEIIKGQLNLLDSPNYARQNGRPVVCLWGPGFTDRPGTAAEALELIQWFKSEHNVFVVGGVPTNWRTSSTDSKPGWLNTYMAYDAIEPWSVGRFSNYDKMDRFYENVDADMRALAGKGIVYKTVIWPGFSWHNMNRANNVSKPLNQIPRAGGSYMWKQAQLSAGRGLTSYVAMFDEFDEGTAIAPVVTNKAQIPAGTTFLTLDADGIQMTSDFYVRLTAEITEMMRSRRSKPSFSTPRLGPAVMLDKRNPEDDTVVVTPKEPTTATVLIWSYAGRPESWPYCWQINEPSDSAEWSDNYLCSNKDLKLQWSSAGPVFGKSCVQISESADPDTWDDNYLCGPKDYGFRWNSSAPVPGMNCLKLAEPTDPDTWDDNYLCYPGDLQP